MTERLEDGLAAAGLALAIESAAIAGSAARTVGGLTAALRLISSTSGRVVVSGLGKSGHIGGKIAATLASTGTRALFVHSAEALHGDSGMAAPGDVGLLISYSGRTAEVCQFGRMLKVRDIPVVAMTGREDSPLRALADVWLSIAVDREADPLGLAPTASTAVTLALGDALAAGLMAMSGFGPADFARFHPGGSLGEDLGASPRAVAR